MGYRKEIFILAAITVLYIIYKLVAGSVLIHNRDRVNIVLYGPDPVFYSLAKNDVNYYFHLPSDSEVEVPGGYGRYRIGALGKLVSLEGKSDIIAKTFSGISLSFVDLYFYPKTDTIYYNDKTSPNIIPSVRSIFFNSSNANSLDRLLLYLFFLRKPVNQFKEISNIPYQTGPDRNLFDREAFFKQFQGFLYAKTYRNIGDNVQILYTKNYKTAILISNILEGEGIQVVDLSETREVQSGCRVIYGKNDKNDPTANDISRFFGCSLQKGQPEVSDIILVLGSLEKSWSVE